MKKANILFTSHTSEFKMGGQISLFNIVKRIDREKYRPFLLCPGTGNLSHNFKEIECPSLYHHFPQLKVLNIVKIVICFLSTINILKKQDINLVHSDHPTDTFYLSICSKVLRIPIIWHTRVSSGSRLDQFNFRLATAIISVSDSVANRFSPRNRRPPKHRIIYNGVDCSLFKPDPNEADRKKFGFGKDKRIITTVCQLIREKGIFELIEAARITCAKSKTCRFIIVGEGTDKITEEIITTIKQKRLDGYVHLVGFKKDIPSILNDSDIFVLASHIEGFPRSVIEAMACGKPVIGTDVEGVREAVEDNVTGLLVPPKDPIRLSEAIQKILWDEGKIKAMGQAGRERAENLFSILQNVHQIENVYQELLSRWNND